MTQRNREGDLHVSSTPRRFSDIRFSDIRFSNTTILGHATTTMLHRSARHHDDSASIRFPTVCMFHLWRQYQKFHPRTVPAIDWIKTIYRFDPFLALLPIYLMLQVEVSVRGRRLGILK